MSNEIGHFEGPKVSKASLIWAIVVKDFVDGLKNRRLLTNVFTIIFLVLLYKFLPILGNTGDPPFVVLYDAGASSVVRELDKSEAVRLRSVESYDEMIYQVGIENYQTIGLKLPTDFDLQLTLNAEIELEAIVDHWVSDEDETSMREALEAELKRITGLTIQVIIERDTITQADGAFAFYIALLLLLVMGLMGMMFTPQLMIEEKEARTLDALQVSPVTMTEMLIAKGIVGGAYSLLASVAVLIAYGQFVMHWWAMLGAILAGAFFNVALGLLLGMLLKDTRQVGLWGFILFQPLIITMILGLFEPIPAGIRAAMRWTPAVAMGNAAAQSITASVDLGPYFLAILITVAWGALFGGLTLWLMRRAEK